MKKIIVNTGKCGYIEKDKILPIQNVRNSKPLGGLWGCFEDTKPGCSWKDWCKSEEPSWVNKYDAIITVSDNCKILVIDSIDVYNSLPKRQYEGELAYLATLVPEMKDWIDWEQLSNEYDLIDLRLSASCELKEKFYSFDCDSAYILNKEIIEDIEQNFSKEDIEIDNSHKTIF